MNVDEEQIFDRLDSELSEIEVRLNDRIDEQFHLIDQKLEAQEQLVSNLMMAYAELTNSLEATITEMMSPKDEAEKEDFRNQLMKARVEAHQMMKEIADEVARGSEEQPGNSVLSMAARQQADRSNQVGDSAPGGEGEDSNDSP